jgi:transcription initiation factor TFIIB
MSNLQINPPRNNGVELKRKPKNKTLKLSTQPSKPKAKTKTNSRSTTARKEQMWKAFDSDILESRMSELPVTAEPNLLADHNNNTNDGINSRCKQCGTLTQLLDSEELICPNSECSVVAKIISQAPEWRYYGADDKNSADPTRCGMPINPLLQQSSFGCLVLNSFGMTYEMRKIKKITNCQAMPYNEQTQNKDFQYIACMARLGGIPKIIIDSAIQTHKKISDHHKSFRGINRDGVLGASIYIACTVCGFPRTPTEISKIFYLDQASVTKGVKNAINIINDLEKNCDNSNKTVFSKTESVSFIQRFCSRLNMNSELTKLCQFIANKIEASNFMPENIPYSIAAGIIYFVSSKCAQPITKTHISQTTNISEVTITKCFKKLELHKPNLMPTPILQKYAQHQQV